jgi:hypothetical protein
MNCHLPPRNSSRPDTLVGGGWLCVTPDSTPPNYLFFYRNAVSVNRWTWLLTQLVQDVFYKTLSVCRMKEIRQAAEATIT